MRKITLALVASALVFVPYITRADVAVHNAISFETAPGMKVGAALMGLHADQTDKLVSATSPVAARVEIHNMSEENGIMKMRKVDSVELPADQTVALSPSGYHIMLMDLKEPLKAGTEFPLTLTFENSKPVEVEVEVKSRSEMNKAAEDAAPSAEHHGH